MKRHSAGPAPTEGNRDSQCPLLLKSLKVSFPQTPGLIDLTMGLWLIPCKISFHLFFFFLSTFSPFLKNLFIYLYFFLTAPSLHCGVGFLQFWQVGRGAWRAIVHGVASAGHDLAAKSPPPPPTWLKAGNRSRCCDLS